MASAPRFFTFIYFPFHCKPRFHGIHLPFKYRAARWMVAQVRKDRQSAYRSGPCSTAILQPSDEALLLSRFTYAQARYATTAGALHSLPCCRFSSGTQPLHTSGDPPHFQVAYNTHICRSFPYWIVLLRKLLICRGAKF